MEKLDFSDLLIKYKLTFSQVIDEYQDLYKSSLETMEKRFSKLENDVDLINNLSDREVVSRVIVNIKDNDYSFSNTDVSDLEVFIRNLDKFIKIDNFLNNFTNGKPIANNKKINLPELLNDIRVYNVVDEFTEDFSSHLNPHKINLFCTIKHLQFPNEYPIYYKFWKQICTEVLDIHDDYNSFREFFLNFPNKDRHLNFAGYFNVLGKLILDDIRNPKSAVSLNSSGLKKLKRIFSYEGFNEDIKEIEEKYMSYTWVKVFKSFNKYLLKYRNNQAELIDLMEKAGIRKRDGDEKLDLELIDPFSFIFYIIKYSDSRRILYITELLKLFKIKIDPPLDFKGVPNGDARKAHLYDHDANDGGKSDVDLLWNLYSEFKENSISNETLKNVLAIKGVAKAKLTEAFFLLNPENYFPVDGQTIPWMKRHGMTNFEVKTIDQYNEILAQVVQADERPFYEISHDAYIQNTITSPDSTPVDAKVIYAYLNNSHSHRKIQIDILEKEAPANGGGFDAMVILHEYDIRRDKKGILKRLSFAHEISNAKGKYKDALELLQKHYPEFGHKLKESGEMNENKELNNISGKFPLNQILYGPPGTGKTFKTVEMAVEIADPIWFALNKSNRIAVKAKYDELVSLGRVVFTTFHQSFSYEDFIEGIRAETDDDTGQIIYSIKPGVFNELCETASNEMVGTSEVIELGSGKIWKIAPGSSNDNNVEDRIDQWYDGNYAALHYGEAINYSDCEDFDAILKKGNINNTSENKQSDFRFSAIDTLKNKMTKGDIVILSNKSDRFRAIGVVIDEYMFNSEERFGATQSRGVKWIVKYKNDIKANLFYSKNFGRQAICSLDEKHVDILKLQNLISSPEVLAQKNNHVIIIDEINRGNISKIFGELITLLEDSKRSGRGDSQKVTLPYSKKPFEIPDNIHVIGTMNTADKSLQHLDMALRRRFTFQEIMPDPTSLNAEIHNVKVSEILDKINKRIEVLLDRDHQIGHSYFLELNDLNSVEEKELKLSVIFKNKLIPLLHEYFFDDLERMSLVLNDHAKKDSNSYIVKNENKNELEKIFGKKSSDIVTSQNYKTNKNALNEPEFYAGIVKSHIQIEKEEA